MPVLTAPILTFSPSTLDQLSSIDVDGLCSMWTVFTKCKQSLDQGHRLENLSWRLWYREINALDSLLPQSKHEERVASPPLAVSPKSFQRILSSSIPSHFSSSFSSSSCLVPTSHSQMAPAKSGTDPQHASSWHPSTAPPNELATATAPELDHNIVSSFDSSICSFSSSTSSQGTLVGFHEKHTNTPYRFRPNSDAGSNPSNSHSRRPSAHRQNSSTRFFIHKDPEEQEDDFEDMDDDISDYDDGEELPVPSAPPPSMNSLECTPPPITATRVATTDILFEKIDIRQVVPQRSLLSAQLQQCDRPSLHPTPIRYHERDGPRPRLEQQRLMRSKPSIRQDLHALEKRCVRFVEADFACEEEPTQANRAASDLSQSVQRSLWRERLFKPRPGECRSTNEIDEGETANPVFCEEGW
ncbi:uncharacterized protein VTP21DRAFT_5834 [Calcarisporiella thermophila]|uniref:uncharacterized protein n=1 Tax=Calcarisporiella thermophila TaxID=911321 RepID=UPI0037441256